MRIGEVARLSGVSVRMLRHYDRLGLVVPSARTSSGYRVYGDGDVRRLFHVESLRTLGLSLGDVARALDEPGFAPAELVDDLARAARQRMAEDEELLARLHRIRGLNPESWDEVLPIVALLRGLGSADPSRRLRAALESEGGGADVLTEALLAEDDPNARGALGWALRSAADQAGRMPDEASDAVVDALASPDADLRRRGVDVLAWVGDTIPGHADLLVSALADDAAPVRSRAALALGAGGDLRAVPALVDAVAGGHGDVEAGETLGKLARRHTCAERITADLLGAIADSAADPGAGSVAGESVRVRIVHALAELPGDAVVRALERFADDPYRRVALTAASVLTSRSSS